MGKSKSDVGLIGLAVMGQNLAMNIYDCGYKISVYNRSEEKTKNFSAEVAKDSKINFCYSLEEFVISIKRPRKIFLMVKAGDVVDIFIKNLISYLEKGDIIIDGGNSLYTDTQRRLELLESQEILYIGSGISGGEEGARFGPSIMPGGSEKAWELVKDILQSISAKAEDGLPCCDWVGKGGSGHYAKMVHNGIEYGDMQLICEAYHLLKTIGCSNEEIKDIFLIWNQGNSIVFL